ncbi:hypothetical protein B484DRAFT_431661 [Ochromonadaceae sp. CCMP2298]|nr:hypothetical protein B484DRAFT_431661 [Ochromonadaceae sp. CCMP2298]
MIDCYRDLENAVTPFIPVSESLSLAVTKSGDSYRGVNFTTTAENVSPHIYQTHCESALHVFCRDVASSLADVLAQKEELQGLLSAHHIKVEPTSADSIMVELTFAADGVVRISYGGDEYCVLPRDGSQTTVQSFSDDRIVTKRAVQDALGGAISGGEVKVLLIDIVGEEECIANWAFPSTDAVRYLMDLGVEVLVLNTPSIDRENDGGYVPNHKIVFEQKQRLVVELARLAHVPCGAGTALLNVRPHDTYADCGPCHVQFTPTNCI